MSSSLVKGYEPTNMDKKCAGRFFWDLSLLMESAGRDFEGKYLSDSRSGRREQKRLESQRLTKHSLHKNRDNWALEVILDPFGLFQTP